MKRNRHSKESYAILINGKRAFTVLARSQIGAVIKAEGDSRYRKIVQERQGEFLVVSAIRIADL